jgi:iduronate 2-sulfatase
MKKFNLTIFFGILLIPSLAFAQSIPSKTERPNVLFIVVDDLRPELGCYGQDHIKSPNIDRLARSGLQFSNAYCNYPVCGPSRASLLSGIYTSDNRLSPGFDISQDDYLPGITSLPMHFRNHGYTTVSLGKVYHNFTDGKGSWDRIWLPSMITSPAWWDYQSDKGKRIFAELNKDRHQDSQVGDNRALPRSGLPYERPDVPDIAYNDGKIAIRAMEELQGLQNRAEPFFLAVGFVKPHLPFNAPARYWDMYDKKDISLPSNYYFPENAPDAAIFNWGELRSYHGIPKEGPLSDSTALNLIHGYYACVSFIDAQVGLLLDALEDLKLVDNTIIVLCGDHGYFLGEHGFWSKHSNMKRAAHSPLILSVPWKDAGLKTNAIVEFVDIFPTISELAGINKPFHLQGKSFAPLMDDPSQTWKQEAFYRVKNGETIITDTHTYTEWFNYDTGKSYARMLYDHRTDPEENLNVAESRENKDLIRDLSERLHKHIHKRDYIKLP